MRGLCNYDGFVCLRWQQLAEARYWRQMHSKTRNGRPIRSTCTAITGRAIKREMRQRRLPCRLTRERIRRHAPAVKACGGSQTSITPGGDEPLMYQQLVVHVISPRYRHRLLPSYFSTIDKQSPRPSLPPRRRLPRSQQSFVGCVLEPTGQSTQAMVVRCSDRRCNAEHGSRPLSSIST